MSAVLSGNSLKYTFNTIIKLLKIAANHGGVACGEFVAFTVPKILSYDFENVHLQDVTIWFTNMNDLNSFTDHTEMVEVEGLDDFFPYSFTYLCADKYNDVIAQIVCVVSIDNPFKGISNLMSTLSVTPNGLKIRSRCPTSKIYSYSRSKPVVEFEDNIDIILKNYNYDRWTSLLTRIKTRFGQECTIIYSGGKYHVSNAATLVKVETEPKVRIIPIQSSDCEGGTGTTDDNPVPENTRRLSDVAQSEGHLSERDDKVKEMFDALKELEALSCINMERIRLGLPFDDPSVFNNKMTELLRKYM